MARIGLARLTLQSRCRTLTRIPFPSQTHLFILLRTWGAYVYKRYLADCLSSFPTASSLLCSLLPLSRLTSPLFSSSSLSPHLTSVLFFLSSPPPSTAMCSHGMCAPSRRSSRPLTLPFTCLPRAHDRRRRIPRHRLSARSLSLGKSSGMLARHRAECRRDRMGGAAMQDDDRLGNTARARTRRASVRCLRGDGGVRVAVCVLAPSSQPARTGCQRRAQKPPASIRDLLVRDCVRYVPEDLCCRTH
jgi:hypothetical protein